MIDYLREQQDNADVIREGFLYDPAVKCIDANFWKDIAGTSTVSTGDIRLNQDEITSYSQYRYADLTMCVNIATTPSAGEAKVWGFRNEGAKTLGAAYFEITGTTFRAVTYNDEGATTATNITWNSRGQTWEAVMATYRILWTKQSVKFFITTLAAPTAEGDFYVEHKANVPSVPLAINIDNENDADNLDIDWVRVNR